MCPVENVALAAFYMDIKIKVQSFDPRTKTQKRRGGKINTSATEKYRRALYVSERHMDVKIGGKWEGAENGVTSCSLLSEVSVSVVRFPWREAEDKQS